jgi:tRNA-dihydrouridine synthase
MLGRGALSNPWLIRQSWECLKGLPITLTNSQERAEFVVEFLLKMSRELPPPLVLGKLKKLGGCLSKGLPGSSRLRARMYEAKTPEEFFVAIRAHFAAEFPPV